MTSLLSPAGISRPSRSQPTGRSRMPTCWRSLVVMGHASPPSIGVLRRWPVGAIWCWYQSPELIDQYRRPCVPRWLQWRLWSLARPRLTIGVDPEGGARRSISEPPPDHPGTVSRAHHRCIDLEVVVTVSMAGGLGQLYRGDDIFRHRSAYLSPGCGSPLPDDVDRTE